MGEHAVDDALRELFRAEEGPAAPLRAPRRPRRRPRPALLVAAAATVAVLTGSVVFDVVRDSGGDSGEAGCIVLATFEGRTYRGFSPVDGLTEVGRLLGGARSPTGCDDVRGGGYRERTGSRIVEVRTLDGIDPRLAVAVNHAEWPGREDWIFVADQVVCASANPTKETYVACLRAASASPASLP